MNIFRSLQTVNNIPTNSDERNDLPVEMVSNKGVYSPGVERCTSQQLQIIKTQVPPDDCEEYVDKPHTQRCSFSYATRCPNSVWVDDYYKQLHGRRRDTGKQQKQQTGIIVGCNKGMDAINTLRMLSGNADVDLGSWIETMNVTDNARNDGVCHQARAHNQFPILQEEGGTSRSRSSQVFCIEPMPATYQRLAQSASKLGYDKKGFTVTHAAISKQDGSVSFPSTQVTGKEQGSIEHCATNSEANCVNVDMYSLDTYVSKFLSDDTQINYLSVDVEGFDQDVLLGGQSILNRVQYLEFEYK